MVCWYCDLSYCCSLCGKKCEAGYTVYGVFCHSMFYFPLCSNSSIVFIFETLFLVMLIVKKKKKR